MVALAAASAVAGIGALTHGARAATQVSNGTNNLNQTSSWVSGVVPGSGDIAQWNNTVTGAFLGTLGAPTTWGEIQIQNPGGAITIGNATDVGAGNSLTLNGINGVGIDMSAATKGLTLSDLTILGASQQWNVGTGQALTVTQSVGDSGSGFGLTFGGAGTVNLNAAMLFTGPIIQNAGTVSVTNTLANSQVFVNGGTFNANSALGNTVQVYLGNGSTFGGNNALANTNVIYAVSGTETVTANAGGTFNGLFAGNGTLNWASEATLNNVDFNAATGLNTFGNFGGTVAFGASNNSLRLNASSAVPLAPSLNPFATFDLGTGTGAIIARNNGDIIVLGALQSEGTTNIETLNFGNATATGPAASTYIVGSANTNTTFTGSIAATTTGASGYLQLTKVGTGSLTLTRASSVSTLGTLSADGGNLVFSYSPNNVTTNLYPASFLNFGGGSLTVLANSTATAVTSQSFAGTTLSAGGGSLIVNSNGGAGTTVNLGSISAALTGGTLNITTPASGATITSQTNKSADGTYGGRITFTDNSGNTNFATGTLNGSGTYTLSGYTGYSAFAGTGDSSATDYLINNNASVSSADNVNLLKITNSTPGQSLGLGGNTLTVQNGGVLFTGANNYSITGSGAPGLVPGTSNEVIFHQFGSGVLSVSAAIGDGTMGGSSLTKDGPGTLSLTGTNTYTGQTFINQGILSINSNSSLGSSGNGSAVNFDGGTLQLSSGSVTLDNGGGSAARSINIGGGGGTFNVGSGATLTVDGTVSNLLANEFGPLIKNGPGTLALTGTNTYIGATIISGGMITTNNITTSNTASGIGQSPAAAGALILDGGALQYTGAQTSTDRTFTITNNGGTLDSSGSGPITFASILPVVNIGSSNRTLTLQGSNNGIIDLPIGNPTGGALSLVMAGSGQWTLGGVNSYTGSTSINSGVLALAPGATIASGNIGVASGSTFDVSNLTSGITVGAGQTISGQGTVNGTVNLTSGSLTPGNTAAGSGSLSIANLNVSAGKAPLFNYYLNTGNSSTEVAVTNSNGLTLNGGGFDLFKAGTALPDTTTGVFNIFSYVGSVQGAGVAALSPASILNPYPGLSYAFSNNGSGLIQLTVSGTPGIIGTWFGGTGNWSNSSGNWTDTGGGNTPPHIAGDDAIFGNNNTTAAVVTLDVPETVGNITFNSPGATGSYTISGANTLTLANVTGISANIIDTAGTHIISTPVALNSNTNVSVANSGDSLTLSGQIGGTASLSMSGLGTLALSSANTYSGGTSINGGTTNFVTGALGSGPVTFNGGILQWAVGNTSDISTATVTFSGNGTLDTQSNNVTLAGSIGNNGTGGLIKAGSGTLVLGGANSYGGGTTVNAGTLQISTDANLGTAPGSPTTNLTFNPGTGNTVTLVTTGSVSTSANRNISLANGLTILNNNGNNVTLNGSIIGSGSLTSVGAGTLNLNGADTYSGTTVVGGGTLLLGNALALQGSTLNYNSQGGSVSFGSLTSATFGGLSGGQSLALTNASSAAVALTVGGNGSTNTYSGTLSGNGASLNKAGAGTLFLTSANSYTGGTTFTGGLVNFIPGAIGSGPLTFNGGGLQWATGNTTDISSKVVTFAANGTLDTNGNNVTLANAIGNSGTGGLIKAGSGTLLLQGANTFSGGVSINGGVLSMSSPGNLGTLPGSPTTSVTFNPGSGNTGTLQTTSATSFTANQNWLLSSGLAQLDTKGNIDTIAGVISGAGALNIINGGTVLFSGVNTNSGAISIPSGVIARAGSTNPLGTGNVTLGGTFDLNGNNATLGGSLSGAGTVDNLSPTPVTLDLTSGTTSTFSGVIKNTSGALSLNKAGAATLDLTGTNTFTGPTNIAAGVLFAGTSGALANTSSITIDTATGLQLANGVTISAPIFDNIGGSEWADVPGSASATLTGAITTVGTTQFRTGTSGNATQTTGILDITGPITIGNAVTVNFEKGNFIMSGNASLTMGQIGNQQFYFGRGNASFNMTLQDNATITLTDDGTPGTNVPTLGATTQVLSNLNLFGNSAFNAGTTGFELNGVTATNDTTTLTLGGVGTDGISGASTLTVGYFTKTAVGANNITKFYFNGGTLAATTSSTAFLPLAAGLTTAVSAGGAIINVGANNPIFNSPLVTDPRLNGTADGGLTLLGAGSLTLNGANTYTGTTTVKPGATLIFNDAAASSNTPGSVVNNGTLSVTGTASFGTISGTGTLSIGAAGNVMLNEHQSVSSVNTLSLAPTGTLDVTNNALLINYSAAGQTSPDAAIRAALISGSGTNGVTYNGVGIISSTAARLNAALVANNGTPAYGVGYADGSDPYLNNEGPAAGVEEVKLTLLGDLNLDGFVNSADFILFANSFGKTGGTAAAWDHGDLNYDGSVNSADFILFADEFGKGLGTVSSTDGGLTLAQGGLDAAQVQQFNQIGTDLGISSTELAQLDLKVAAVPEPASLGLLVIGGLGLMGRRRRRN